MNDENIEQLKNEIEKGAELLDMSLEDALKKVDEICLQNGLDKDNDALLVLSLWRQYFSSVKMAQKNADPNQDNPITTTSGGWIKSAFGFFISVEDARDFMEIKRTQLENECGRDFDSCFNSGKIAFIEQADDGFNVSRCHNGETETKSIKNLPENHIEINGGWIVPLDDIQNYGSDVNTNYGKPLPKEQYNRAAIFIGEVNGVLGQYFFNYKGEHSKLFIPDTFKYVHFVCIINKNMPNKIHGITNKTLASLIYNDDLSDDSDVKRDMSNDNIADVLMNFSQDNYSPILDLDRYHSVNASKPYNEKYVITDGSVSSMNMTLTKNGNRIVSISDLNADFDYDGDGWSGTTCWIPEHIKLDFGIGSSIIVVGRTAQRTNDDGQLDSATINVSGILVTENRGKLMSNVDIPVEENIDWF
jgi:hypothetical protein